MLRSYTPRLSAEATQDNSNTFLLPSFLRFSSLSFTVRVGYVRYYMVYNVATCVSPPLPLSFRLFSLCQRSGSRIGFLSRCRTSACICVTYRSRQVTPRVHIGKISPFFRGCSLPSVFPSIPSPYLSVFPSGPELELTLKVT